MHPYTFLEIFLYSSCALVLLQAADFAIRLIKKPKLIWRWLYSCVPFILATAVLCGYFYLVTVNTGVEIPLTSAAVEESGQEFWLTLPPHAYWSALVFYDSPATTAEDINNSETSFYFEYSVYVNDKPAHKEGKHIQDTREDIAFIDEILVKSRYDVVHVVLHAKSDSEDVALPKMGYIIQRVSELKYYAHGPRINPRTHGWRPAD